MCCEREKMDICKKKKKKKKCYRIAGHTVIYSVYLDIDISSLANAKAHILWKPY